MVGKTISHYKVLEKIGEGGMGEVYRATDTKLNRDVALKILPERFASDSQRMGRFQREAEVLASLDHPNIGQIYGIEEAGQTKALVLQLIEGPTLADKIAQGAIPVEDTLKIALQIAEGLEAAHEKGVIHRDLKPANIKITPEGQVKILDFGLAKALEGDAPDSSLSQSPTLTHAATQAGVILGTAAYMAPEQARGHAVDKRTDIWAFGCVLYEMLSGKVAFPGDDITDILAAIVRAEPVWSALPDGSHPRLRESLERCLEKDPKTRWHHIADVRIDIERIQADTTGLLQPANQTTPRTWRRLLPWAAGVAGVILAALLTNALVESPPGTTDRLTRLTVTLPPDQRLAGRRPLALSPDGSQLVYTSSIGDQPRLYLRPLDQYEASLIPGTEGAENPFFSPDGQSVGFFANGQMKTVPLAGGLPSSLAAAPWSWGATWSEDGWIIYSPTVNSGLWRVSEDGGPAEQLTQPDFADTGYGHTYPQYLPDGRTVLFSIWGHVDDGKALFSAAVLSLDTMQWEPILSSGAVSYVPTGHLLFKSAGERQLLATPFDLSSLSPGANRVGVLADIFSYPGGGGYSFSNSSNGTLAYLPLDPPERLVWVDRQGGTEPLEFPAGRYVVPRLSPGGERVAVLEMTGDRGTWRVIDILSGTPTTIPQDTNTLSILWMPNGRNMAFSSNRAGSWDIYSIDVDSGTEAEELLVKEFDQFPDSWSPDESLHDPGLT